jgi:TonB family protein
VEEVKVEAQQPCKNVNAPTLIYHVDPEYPEAARKKRLEGKVVLEAILTADGNVEDIKVLSSPSETLTRVAIQAFSRWRYKPASCEGKPIRVYLTTTTTFSLDGRPKGRH